MQLPLFVQGFTFAWGPSVIELVSTTLAHPLPEANEQYLESRLVGSAEANEASL